MFTFSRMSIAAVALFSLLLSLTSESVAERACRGRHCKRPVAHQPHKPAHQPSRGGQCLLPVVPPLNLNRCDRRGHDRARTEYSCDVKQGMDLIDSLLANQASMPIKMCRLLVGDFRKNCCEQLRTTAIERCKAGVDANAQQDRKCAFTPPCRRKLLCLKDWIIEEKRSQCCASLKPQGIELLKGYCETRVNAMTASCSVSMLPSTPTPDSNSVGTQPTDRYVTIQPIGPVVPYNPNLISTPGELPDQIQDGSAAAE